MHSELPRRNGGTLPNHCRSALATPQTCSFSCHHAYRHAAKSLLNLQPRTLLRYSKSRCQTTVAVRPSVRSRMSTCGMPIIRVMKGDAAIIAALGRTLAETRLLQLNFGPSLNNCCPSCTWLQLSSVSSSLWRMIGSSGPKQPRSNMPAKICKSHLHRVGSTFGCIRPFRSIHQNGLM
jgi:hypothetical protein